MKVGKCDLDKLVRDMKGKAVDYLSGFNDRNGNRLRMIIWPYTEKVHIKRWENDEWAVLKEFHSLKDAVSFWNDIVAEEEIGE